MSAKRQPVEPTDDWDTLVPLFWWPEQEEYEQIRQPVLFGTSVAERAEEVGVSESTLRRSIGASESMAWTGFTPRRRPNAKGCLPSSGVSLWTSRPSTRPSAWAR